MDQRRESRDGRASYLISSKESRKYSKKGKRKGKNKDKKKKRR